LGLCIASLLLTDVEHGPSVFFNQAPSIL